MTGTISGMGSLDPLSGEFTLSGTLAPSADGVLVKTPFFKAKKALDMAGASVILSGLKRRFVVESNLLTSEEFDTVQASYTNADGSVDWTGLLTFLQGLLTTITTNGPALIALITALLAAFGL